MRLRAIGGTLDGQDVEALGHFYVNPAVEKYVRRRIREGNMETGQEPVYALVLVGVEAATKFDSIPLYRDGTEDGPTP